MSDTPEGRVKKDVKELLKKHNAFFTMPVPSGYGESMLDFVGHCRGRYFEIETKAPGKHPTPRQQHRIDRVMESGGHAFVIGEERNDPMGPCVDEWSGMDELEAWLLLS